MSAWANVPFSDLLIESRDGEWGEGGAKIGHQLCEIIRGTDFANLNGQNIELPRRWIPDHLVERKKLQIGDIVFEMAGGTAKQSTGRSAILNDRFFERHKEHPVLCASFCRHLRLNQERFNPQFIYFMLQALYGAGYMSVYNIQHTGVSRFQYTSFKKMTVLNIPSLINQEKIAAILSAYDDLIENNQRRIALLEKMAEEIYREWFVRMRFPGYENVRIEKGYPKTWTVHRIADVVDRKKFGRIYREDELSSEGSVAVIDQSRSDFLGFYDGEPQHPASEDFPLILFGDHTCKMLIMAKPFSLAENVIPFAAKNLESTYFLFHMIKNLVETTEYKRHWTELTNKQILVPDGSLQLEFDSKVKPLHSQMSYLSSAIRKTEKLRSWLLPRLISGKLSVENLDIHFPPSMRDTGHDL